MISTDYEYQYKYASLFYAEQNKKTFNFSYSTEIEEDKNIPCFFYGNIINSYIASRCLSALANTVNAHYALTPGQIARLKDPIVSVGAGELHFEAFSSCNSVYSRIHILNNGLDGDFLHAGTTNIDFNHATTRAFNNVLANEKLLVGIGSKEVQVITEKSTTIEKKVSLPNRWIKGLGNVQVYLSEMSLAFELNKFEALQLFKTLPKTISKSPYYLCKNGNAYNFSPLQKINSIEIGGIHRLALIQNLIPSIQQLWIYKHETQQCFAVILDFNEIRMTYLFSNSVYRGFSGEGKLLADLTNSTTTDLIYGINSFFKTNEIFNPSLISIENNIDLQVMAGLQATLSGIGLLGYNLIDNNYFYRRLPFKLERLLGLNPRLQNAKKLIENKEIIIIENTKEIVKANVKGTNNIYHTVIKKHDEYQCTCNWYTNNKNNRGLCKHILALVLILNE